MQVSYISLETFVSVSNIALGIPCIDMGFSGGQDTAVYHYHSNYDSFHWMETYGDPGWHYHVTIAKLWALLAAKIIETPIIQLNATDYAIGLKKYLESVKDKALNRTVEAVADNEIAARYSESKTQGLPFNISFHGLDFLVAKFHNTSVTFDAEAAELLSDLEKNPLPWWKWWSKVKQYRHIKSVNDKYKFLERQFLHAKGLDGRPWFKHVVFAPGIWTGYAGATFPGLVEAIDSGDVGGVYKWLGIVNGIIVDAQKYLSAK
jgi:N-acetylated-alpha-linked acidic dipeptidase